MRKRLNVLLFAATLHVAAAAQTSSTCTSVLTDSQLREFETMVFPLRPYSANLSESDRGDVQGVVKRLNSKEIERFRAFGKPWVGPTRNVLSEQEVAPLKRWLRANPSVDVPAWESTVVGIVVPGAWIGLTADSFVQLMNEPGDAGPVKTTALSNATSQGRALGVTQHVAVDSSGQVKFLWSYVYEAAFQGRLITMLLAVCQANVVAVVANPSETVSDDESELLAIEQQLARAWARRDRETLERILAPEWSVTAPEGTTSTRATVLEAMFGANVSVSIVQAITTDDLTVTRFDSAAVVRGRTVAIVMRDGIAETTAIRFTDLCVKRDATWQVVASHQTRVLK